jgi:hypothetical protein
VTHFDQISLSRFSQKRDRDEERFLLKCCGPSERKKRKESFSVIAGQAPLHGKAVLAARMSPLRIRAVR